MNLRRATTVLAVICACLAAPLAASAKSVSHASTTTATSLKNIPVTGTADNGKAFVGQYTVTQFVTHNGQTDTMGILTGKIGKKSIKPTVVRMPAKVMKASTGSSSSTNASAAAACPILHLILGPLHLNLLGLHVDLNQVVLNITAVSGPGNLLGNLLCGVSNLLNTQSILGQQLTGLLNIVQTLVNTPVLNGL